ncbi:hypothetical protein M427DRAFT_114003 [Gonapodya prolifera JEL478]|uniref:Ribosomal RNA-processing protein 8 n=1 Tax=Gonapodya prolifera (strain JEL478) TaxID=1344416 RepID=A0A139A754_GONPJ|nr:hypothetical protein M427DRAFT_114003 [Gonapodya prolifera JEL478]|eukprot:KXS12499.1 hypothetical protein M427DRAFT_114003 [Gonapodya prolifera JEL478]
MPSSDPHASHKKRKRDNEDSNPSGKLVKTTKSTIDGSIASNSTPSQSSRKKSPLDLKSKKRLLSAIAKRKARASGSQPATNGPEKEISRSYESSPPKDPSRTNVDGVKHTSQPVLPPSLAAAQFRFLNEKLYTTTSDAAWAMFQKDSEDGRAMWESYHRGFRSQVEVWPVNPLDIIIQSLKSEYLKGGGKDLAVVDLGCGEAKLAQELTKGSLPASRGSPAVGKVGENTVKVWSFDLCEDSQGWVTACDIKKVPLLSSSVDVAVFCLSLMGTNYIDFVKEATRLLKTGGTLKIAEVISRFSNASNNTATKHPKSHRDHSDDIPSTNSKSIQSFVSALRRLGLDLAKQDTSNKMFVLFDFIKRSAGGKSTGVIDAPPLKPCVYKKR